MITIIHKKIQYGNHKKKLKCPHCGEILWNIDACSCFACNTTLPEKLQHLAINDIIKLEFHRCKNAKY